MRSEEDRRHRPAGRSGEGHLTLLSETLANNSRTIFVFGGTDAAEAFRIVGAIEGPPEEIAGLLGACAATGARYVCLNPPTGPHKAFMDHMPEEPEAP